MNAIGHNNPPDPLDEALAPYGDAISEAEGWLDGEAVTNEGQMKAVDTLLRTIKDAEKAVKAAEESEAKPIYDQWKAAKARYTPTLDDLGRMKKGLAALVDGFKRKLAAEKAEAQRKAQEEAARARREAEEKARAADAANIDAQREAAAAQAEAERLAAEATKASKDKVKGLRTVTRYEIEDHRAALHWIAQNDREAMTAFIEEYVRRNHKAVDIAGVRVWQDKEAF
jgi:pyruvate/2-oxoglutarate dehydrogenase complex dihydrolipoamide acyltransferase (E2) component